MKKDGTFQAQQDLLSMLREEEAESAYRRSLERDAIQARRQQSDAATAHAHGIERDWQQARIGHQIKTIQDRMERELRESPFSFAADEFYDMVHQATGGGSVPALLVAPFVRDDLNGQQNDEGPQSFRFSIRRAWSQSEWSADLAGMDGAISRPLRNTDVDILIIQRALRDLPVVLVYGVVQANRRVWPSLCAWNIVDSPELRSIHMTFPPLPLPDPVPDSAPQSAAQLAFEDELGTSTAITAGLIAEWFHLVRSGRTPRLHALLPTELTGERRVIAAGLAASYEVALERERIDAVSGRVGQAEMYVAAELRDQAAGAALQALAAAEQAVRSDQATVPPASLRRLIPLLESLDLYEETPRARQALESAARLSVLRNLGWRNR
ncbi:hypothetical protein [Streptomyces sp. NPDC002054]|uniref:hypothetical protein n=1 Tax=Streptomyces sp. NPDC002054 TaxID=3154663 RepID=UPI0033230001